MRKLKLLLVAFASLLLMTACGNSTAVGSYTEKYKTDDIPDGAYYIGEDTVAAAVFDNKIFTSGASIGYYDIADNMEYTKLYDIERGNTEMDIFENEYFEPIYLFLIGHTYTPSLAVNDGGIYYINDSVILHIGFDGEVIASYDTPSVDGGCLMENWIYASNDYIYAIIQYSFETEDGYIHENYLYTYDKNGLAAETHLELEGKEVFRIMNCTPGGNNNEILMLAVCYESEVRDPIHSECVIRVKGKTGELELISETSSAAYSDAFDCVSGGGEMYSCQSNAGGYTFGVTDIETGDFVGMRSVMTSSVFGMIEGELNKNGAPVKKMGIEALAFTGYDYVAWDYNNKVLCVLSEKSNDTGEELTVLAPIETTSVAPNESPGGFMCRESVIMNAQFEEENGVPVRLMGLDFNTFNDKLRMKMLAGENDYDVVFLEKAPELLASILKYELYLPLEGYEKITSGFEKYIDGVESAMTYDGHLFGLPYAVTGCAYATASRFDDSGLTKPDTDCTLEDFWSLCEEARSAGRTALANDRFIFRELMKMVVEDGVQNNNLSKAAIKKETETWQKYRECGVLTGHDFGRYMLNLVTATAGYSLESSYKACTDLMSLPNCGGKNYYNIESMTYVNAKTAKPKLAAEYLALMLYGDYISCYNPYVKSFLTKDTASYFNYTSGRLDNGYALVKKPYELDKAQIFAVENGAKVFANAAPRLYAYGMDDFLEAVYYGLAEGGLTIDEAADKLYSEAKYRFIE